MVIQLLYTQNITLVPSECRKTRFFMQDEPTKCYNMLHDWSLSHANIQRLFASVRNSFCWTSSVHLQYFCKIHCESWKTCCWKFAEEYHHVREKCTEPCMNIRSHFQCWTNTKYECMYYCLFFLQNLHYIHTSAAKIMNVGVTKIHMQLVTFLLCNLKRDFIGSIFFKYINSDC
jgi:hypothetical protein